MSNEFKALLFGMLLASAGTYAIVSAIKPHQCTASDEAIKQVSSLVKSNGEAVKQAQESLIATLKALNNLPADKQDALKILDQHQAQIVKLAQATAQLEDEKKRVKEGCPK
jgi:hypothetical protein